LNGLLTLCMVKIHYLYYNYLMYKKSFRGLTLLLISVTVLLLSACNDSPALLYNNFLADLDVITRFDLSISKLSDGKYDAYTHDEIKALEQDLSSWNGKDAETTEINDLFIESARNMFDCAGFLKNGSSREAEAALEKVNSLFTDAKALIIIYNMGSEYV